MRGELIQVWDATWSEIWVKLLRDPEIGDEVAADLYRELVPEPVPPEAPVPQELNADGEIFLEEDIAARAAYEEELERYADRRALYDEAASGSEKTREALRDGIKSEIRTEAQAVGALEAAWRVVEGYGTDAFSNRYFRLVDEFLSKYSLRYDLRRPFSLHPTLPGIFAALMAELRHVAAADAALSELIYEFDEAVRDLRRDRSGRSIKTCIHRQMNLLEGLAERHPAATGGSLGEMCGQVATWPHATVREVTKKLYGFSSNYPGIRHAGNPASALRDIEMRDMVAVSILLAGCMPYLTEMMDHERIYRGGFE